VTSGLVVVVALIAGVAGYLADNQAAAGDKLRGDFARRARFAAELTGAALRASAAMNLEYAKEHFSGPVSELRAAVDAEGETESITVVQSAAGEVIAASPASLFGETGVTLTAGIFDRAVQSDQMSFGDILPDAGAQRILIAVPFDSAFGRRVWTTTVPAEVVATFTRAYLSSALGVGSGRAFVVDANGRLIASSGTEAAGSMPADRALTAALKGTTQGHVGGDYVGSGPVLATTWRIVFAAPDRALMEPIGSSRRVAWQMFAAFVLVMAGLFAFAVTALNRSARLAYARLHDSLTGLPNRTLFLEHAQRVLDQRRNRDGVAVLFIDLDGFKPVNDRHGHAVGDALLVAVATRLRTALRRNDLPCRFGGDEFLVLCAGLTGEQDPVSVADRIQRSFAEPFQVGGVTVSVGSSIGIATYDETVGNAANLIHHADLAMYQAKQRGKGRITHLAEAG
jgi:diguanylate cyclase (GGDEF)-like protein